MATKEQAFIELFSEEDLCDIDELYCGYYEDYEEFVTNYLLECLGIELPTWLVVDFKKTWETLPGYDQVDNHYFMRS